jgi:ActR/RegA family two-component response regulator
MTRSALIFSTEGQFRQRLSNALQTIGLFTMTAETEKEAMSLLHDLPFDVALIDERAGGGSPERIHSRFRQVNSKAPYVLLADDAVPAPGEIRPEMLVRVSRNAIPEVLLTVSKIVLK